MRWARRKIMSNHRGQGTFWGKYKGGEVGERLEEQVRYNIQVSNEGEDPESLETLTDDDVFKELINIVVDVFSHKSENCMLTFELPSQCDGFATISSDSSICASVSDYFRQEKDKRREKEGFLAKVRSCELIPSRKSSKHERNLKLPINKPSKHSYKKMFDKRLNPIVQTVLHAKQGFTDLDTLFKTRQHSAYRGRWQKCTENDRLDTSEVSEEQKYLGKEWENQKEVVTWDHMIKSEEGPSVEPSFAPDCYTEDIGDSNRRSSVYSQLHEVIDTLQMLINTKHSLPDKHRIEYHIAEIKTHISAIRSYLFPESSYQSFSWDDVMPYPKTQKVGTFISRTRKKRGQDVTLYRIATKKSYESRSCCCQRTNGNKNNSTSANKSKRVYHKKNDRAKINLKNVLRSYQRVKREETELVKVILSQLGLANNVERKRSHSQKYRGHHKDRRMSSRSCQTSDNLYAREHGTIQNSRTLSNHRLKDPEFKEGSRKHKAQVKQEEIDMEDHSTIVSEPHMILKRGNRSKKRLLARQFRTKRERNGKSNRRKRHAKYTKTPLSTEKKYEETSVSYEEEFKPLLKSCFTTGQINQTGGRVLVEAEERECAMPFKEENVMLRIQNATERLENMQDLVEKKLGYLCKQKELCQAIKLAQLNKKSEQEDSEIEEQASKVHKELAFTPKETSSKEPSSEMQDLVEKKLGYLCKQKELCQAIKLAQLNKKSEQEDSEIEEQASKAHKELAFTPKETSSKEQSSESQNDVYELPEATVKTFSSCVRYTNVNLEESRDFKELLKGFEEASSEVTNSKFKGRNNRSSLSSKFEKKSSEDQVSTGKTYICNYMMEMRGCEIKSDHENDTSQIPLVCETKSDHKNDTSEIPLVSEVECDIVTQDCEKNEVLDRGDYNYEKVEENIKEDQEGCGKYKAESNERKKIRGSNSPRKSWCNVC